MKRLRITCLAVLAATAGCTRTEFDDFKRTSFLQRVEVGEVTKSPDGTIKLKGYQNDGGNEALAAAVAAAVTAAIQGAKP